MARYLNIWKENNVVIRKAYECEDGHWLCEDEYMVSIECDDGTMSCLPVMNSEYLKDTTADDYIKECKDDDTEVLMPYDCPARDGKISHHITEWICNDGAVSARTPSEAICSVVSLLVRNGMWKDEYSKFIDIKKIMEEYGKED